MRGDMTDIDKAVGASPKFNPRSITKPMQLAAAWALSIAAVDITFFGAAALLRSQQWVSPFLVISAVLITIVAMFGFYRLITAHRHVLQDDSHYSKDLTNKNKELSRRLETLDNQIAQEVNLTQTRLDYMEIYFQNISQKLNITPHERKRLSRALRESVQAGEDRVSEEMTQIFVRDTQKVFAGGAGGSSEQLNMLIDGVVTSRYERALRAYDEVARDVRSIDLVVDLHRVASVFVPNRGVVKTPEPPILISATPGVIETVLKELLINAAAYSVPRSAIEIEVAPTDGAVELTIANELPSGVAVSDDWLKPGVRGRDSSALYPNGSGMGLPLVQRLLELVKATLQYRQEGTRFVMIVQFRHGYAPNSP